MVMLTNLPWRLDGDTNELPNSFFLYFSLVMLVTTELHYMYYYAHICIDVNVIKSLTVTVQSVPLFNSIIFWTIFVCLSDFFLNSL